MLIKLAVRSFGSLIISETNNLIMVDLPSVIAQATMVLNLLPAATSCSRSVLI